MIRIAIAALLALACMTVAAEAKRPPEQPAQHCRPVFIPKIQAMVIRCTPRKQVGAAPYASGDVATSSQRRARGHKSARSFRGVKHSRAGAAVDRRHRLVRQDVVQIQTDDRFAPAIPAARINRLDARMAGAVRMPASAAGRLAGHLRPVTTPENPRRHAGAVSVNRILGGRPAGCPSAWCGCWLARFFGLSDRSLWVARNWAKFPRVAGPAPGVVAVYARGRGGHVGVVTAVPGPGQIVLKSGNDGHAVRERVRSTRGVIAWVRVA